MNRQNNEQRHVITTPLLAALGALALVIALFFSFYLSTSAYRSEESGITLPSEQSKAPVVSQSGELPASNDALQGVDVRTDNVQRVIASLHRPEAYSYLVQNTLYEGTSAIRTLTRRQFFKQDACRTDVLNDSGSVQRITLRKGEQIYAWESGSSSYYSGKAGSFTDEDSAMLPSYQTVLSLKSEQITAAELSNLAYEPCIRVDTTQGVYRCIYYVSTVSGLLVRADIFKGETMVRQCLISGLSTTAPADSFFQLPNGTSVLTKDT